MRTIVEACINVCDVLWGRERIVLTAYGLLTRLLRVLAAVLVLATRNKVPRGPHMHGLIKTAGLRLLPIVFKLISLNDTLDNAAAEARKAGQDRAQRGSTAIPTLVFVTARYDAAVIQYGLSHKTDLSRYTRRTEVRSVALKFGDVQDDMLDF